MVHRHELALGICFALVLGIVSLAVSMQGWQSRVTAFDLLTYIYGADSLLSEGTLPQHGDTGSYGSYKPPGTAWLMMPSRLLTSDPRLAEYAGTGLLYLAALVGIFVLARRYFGLATGTLAVVLYAVSAHGLFLAGSLWPNGRPDIFVLTVLLASQWVLARDARFLAAALGVWGLGMYIDMAHAPIFLIFPALWLYYRPPVRLLPVMAAAIVVVLIWSPYLLLQIDRGFADARSQLLLQDIFPSDYASAWCDPERQFASLDPPDQADAALVPGNRAGGLLGVISDLKDKSLSNFAGATFVPFGGLILALSTVVSVLLSAAGTADRSGRFHPLRDLRTLVVGGVVAIILGVAVHEVAAEGAAGTTMRLGLAIAVFGLALLTIPPLVAAVDWFSARRGLRLQTPSEAEARRLLVVCLLVPWVFVVAVAEPGKPERFWWLWPLQVIFASALIAYWFPRLVNGRVAIFALVVVLSLLTANSMLFQRLESWRAAGWSGHDSELVQVVDYVAGQLRQDQQSVASIGYQIYVFPFMATYHITNPVYKVGAEFDLFLRYRHGIANTNRCAEGISDEDDLRIVQTHPMPPRGGPRHYFPEDQRERFVLQRDFGLYQVWVRRAE